MRYLIVDASNTFFRARFASHKQSDTWDKLGFAIHVTMASVAKCWRDQKADHVIFCFEGHSWRKDFYEPYKKNRAVARAAMTETQAEEDTLFYESFNNLKDFISNRTNCTVLQHGELEADDLIAGWVQAHPNDHHTIVSSDTDFDSIIAENVNRYNGIADELITITGIFDKKGKRVLDKKTKEPKVVPDPNWILFEKCMRGDPTDNVFSAYPGVRKKGTKNKVGLEEAFADKDAKGFAWNNLMLQRWTDHNEVEHRVLDDYHRNVILVDLTAQPEDIRVKMFETIATNSVPLARPMIGAHFLKFCGKYDLIKMSEQTNIFVKFLEASYPAEAVTWRVLNE